MSDLEVVTFTFKYLSYHGTKACSPEYKKFMSSVYSGNDVFHVGVFCKSLTTQEFLERSKEMENPTTHTPYRLVDPAPYGENVDHSQNRDPRAIAVHPFELLKKGLGIKRFARNANVQLAVIYLSAINSWEQFSVRWDKVLGTTVRQMLKFSSEQVRSDVPHLPHMCHVYVEVKIQSTSECLLPYQYFKVLCA